MNAVIFFILTFSVLHSSVKAHEPLLGTYELDVRIAGELFEDVFRVEQIEMPQFEVIGEFEVPGVFRAPFYGELIGQDMTGDFTAVENGQEFQVGFVGDFGDTCEVTGTLLQAGEVFATFEGYKRGCHDARN